MGEVKTLANLSLQSAAMSISLVLDQVPMRTEISREETSAPGTIVLETVESAMLATLLTPSGNVSQTIQTENLGCSLGGQADFRGQHSWILMTFTNMPNL